MVRSRDFFPIETTGKISTVRSIDLDGLIILDEYLSIDENESLPSGFELFIQHNPELGRQYFRLMDTRQTGAISWSDFAVFYSCKLLVAKNKVMLFDSIRISSSTCETFLDRLSDEINGQRISSSSNVLLQRSAKDFR